MPRLIVYAILISGLLALLPPAIIARVRATPDPNPPVHIFHDMDFQTKYLPQSENTQYADGRAQRPPVLGAVARGETYVDTHYYDGVTNGQWASAMPPQVPLTVELLQRGEARFNIYCTPCHGYDGAGNGIVNQRAIALVSNAAGPVNGTVWVQAKSVHDETVVTQPLGQIFNTITHGVRNMAGYGSQIPVQDRWAIAAYVRVLQRSQNATPDQVPADRRAGL
jgi:mono/diheme cytochrome c family protein